jgi:MOSC domain-containing protein YiiM
VRKPHDSGSGLGLDLRVPQTSPPAHVLSVNVGRPQARDWAGIGRTSIDKQPVTGPVRARALGLDGDQVSDTRHHGGPDQAVYAFAREELDWWEGELGRPVRHGQFGENLTVAGVAVDDALIGERWAIGTAELEVASVRIPCNDFKNWQRVSGYDATSWVKRFTARGRCGAYLRVVREGDGAPGDEVTVLDRPAHDVTVRVMFRALTTERELLPRLLVVDDLAAGVRRTVERYAAPAR